MMRNKDYYGPQLEGMGGGGGGSSGGSGGGGSSGEKAAGAAHVRVSVGEGGAPAAAPS